MTWKAPHKHTGPRPADTYRGARKRSERGVRTSLVLRDARRSLSLTRREAARITGGIRQQLHMIDLELSVPTTRLWHGDGFERQRAKLHEQLAGLGIAA